MSNDREDKYDIKRIELLVRGEAPEDLKEELFVRAYGGMINGEDQILILTDISQCITEMTVDDWHWYNLGLALGERDYKIAKEEMEEALSLSTNKTTH